MHRIDTFSDRRYHAADGGGDAPRGGRPMKRNPYLNRSMVRSLDGFFGRQRELERTMARLADELLSSPQFGERFARRWMDVVRYTDTNGYEWDVPAKGSWEYRDYLIRAFNDDIGFDRSRRVISGTCLAFSIGLKCAYGFHGGQAKHFRRP